MSDTWVAQDFYSHVQSSDRQATSVLVLLLHVRLLLLVLLLLSPPLLCPDRLGWAVLDQIALLVDAAPLRQTIWNIYDSLAVEHVASARIS